MYLLTDNISSIRIHAVFIAAAFPACSSTFVHIHNERKKQQLNELNFLFPYSNSCHFYSSKSSSLYNRTRQSRIRIYFPAYFQSFRKLPESRSNYSLLRAEVPPRCAAQTSASRESDAGNFAKTLKIQVKINP